MYIQIAVKKWLSQNKHYHKQSVVEINGHALVIEHENISIILNYIWMVRSNWLLWVQ